MALCFKKLILDCKLQTQPHKILNICFDGNIYHFGRSKFAIHCTCHKVHPDPLSYAQYHRPGVSNIWPSCTHTVPPTIFKNGLENHFVLFRGKWHFLKNYLRQHPCSPTPIILTLPLEAGRGLFRLKKWVGSHWCGACKVSVTWYSRLWLVDKTLGYVLAACYGATPDCIILAVCQLVAMRRGNLYKPYVTTNRIPAVFVMFWKVVVVRGPRKGAGDGDVWLLLFLKLLTLMYVGELQWFFI